MSKGVPEAAVPAVRKESAVGLSKEECERLGIGPEHPDHRDGRGRSKYRNTPTVHDGVRYDSKIEARRAAELDRMARENLIRFWVPHPRFRLGCPLNVYVADFLVVGPDGHGVWVEDTKGVRTAKFNRDVKLWRAYGPCNLWIINGNDVEVIKPEREGLTR